MIEIQRDPALADTLQAVEALAAQRQEDQKNLKAHTDMLRVWTLKLVVLHQMSQARAAKLAGVHIRTMIGWLNEERAANLARAHQVPRQPEWP